MDFHLVHIYSNQFLYISYFHLKLSSIVKMACNKMTFLHILKCWCYFFANIHCLQTSCMKWTPLWWIRRTRYITFQNDPVHEFIWVRRRYRRNKSMGIWIFWLYILFIYCIYNNLLYL